MDVSGILSSSQKRQKIPWRKTHKVPSQGGWKGGVVCGKEPRNPLPDGGLQIKNTEYTTWSTEGFKNRNLCGRAMKTYGASPASWARDAYDDFFWTTVICGRWSAACGQPVLDTRTTFRYLKSDKHLNIFPPRKVQLLLFQLFSKTRWSASMPLEFHFVITQT